VKTKDGAEEKKITQDYEDLGEIPISQPQSLQMDSALF
jgi:hypothetical protein